MPAILEAYREYTPPRWVRPTVERLLGAIPSRYLSGLGTVVLTDAAAVGAGKTRRVAGRKYERRACLGFYIPTYGGDPPSINIVVDNVLARAPVASLALGLFRDVSLAGVLFHELGHHLDATIGAPAPSGEAAAEAWRRRLERQYYRQRYWWLRPFAGILLRLVNRIRRRGSRKAQLS